MNSILLARASKVIPDQQLLVNVVRLRVRQLNVGHRPLIETPPGMGIADVALSEIAANKITSEPKISVAALAAAAPAEIITFPAQSKKKAA